LPEMLTVTLSRVRRRWQWRSIARAVAGGGAAFGIALVLALTVLEARKASSLWYATAAGGGLGLCIALVHRRISALEAAKMIERSVGSLDNLVITAAEIDAQPRAIADEIRREIDRLAAERLRTIDVRRVIPLAQPVVVALIVVAGCVLLAGIGSDTIPSAAATASAGAALAPGSTSFTLTVSPPAYTRRGVEVLTDPIQASVIAGSRLRISTAHGVFRDWIADVSEGIEIRPDANAKARFISVVVVADASPSLRVVTPGRDSAFAKPAGQVAITVEGGDDLGLASMSVRFTKASGGGENVAFTEGELPLAIERRSDRQWVGRTNVSLEAMGLADGDILVYRAIARDTNPHGSAVQSEQYLIEIGKNAEIADAGFALPAEEKKYAISQQMVIYKTEALLKQKYTIDDTRLIAIEQRMVRAEVVFLGGGEVEDEIEEAAQSNELTEGRLQNTGRAEMLRAINAMSRAEAMLNDGRAREALVLEREALASLERALDRRRYFLRTLPDRSRVDITRRLTGTRSEARSWLRDPATAPASGLIAAHRRVMQELSSAATNIATVDAALAARLTALDPTAPELREAAVGIASAATPEAKQQAIRSAMQAVTAHALKTLAAATVVGIRADPLAGGLNDALASQRPRR
jgi:hypothetical protein